MRHQSLGRVTLHERGRRPRVWITAVRLAAWWALYVTFLSALLLGERTLALVLAFLLAGIVLWILVEGAAWAAVDGDCVFWRSLLRTRRVVLDDVAEVVPGVSPMFRVQLRNGRWLAGPSPEVGPRTRYEFVEAIRTRLAAARPDR